MPSYVTAQIGLIRYNVIRKVSCGHRSHDQCFGAIPIGFSGSRRTSGLLPQGVREAFDGRPPLLEAIGPDQALRQRIAAFMVLALRLGDAGMLLHRVCELAKCLIVSISETVKL
jgi:hypothetical protein